MRAADTFKLSGGSTPISTSVLSPMKRDTLIGGTELARPVSG